MKVKVSNSYGQGAESAAGSSAVQALELEELLPRIMRRLFTLQNDGMYEDLPLAQRRVCTILQAGPRCISLVALELATTCSAVTQIADRLEKSGLVERIAQPDDRRIKRLRLTALGARIMAERREARVQRVRQVLDCMDAATRHRLFVSLHKLAEAAQPAESTEPGAASSNPA